MPSESARPLRLGGLPRPDRLALAVTSLVVVGCSVRWWNAAPTLGDDSSGHVVAFARVAEVLRTGAGWWAPDFNLGFPIGLYYQPLPHVVGGVLTLLAGGGAAAIAVYKVVTVALLAGQPWAMAKGARLLGFDRWSAAGAGIASLCVTSTLGFGLTVHSSVVLALHSQAWAGVALPLAVGYVARALDGRPGAVPRAVAAWAVLMLCHFFYGIALIALGWLWILCRPRDAFGRLLRFGWVGALTAVTLAFWFVPLGVALDYGGGWPFGGSERVDGYGVAAVLRPLLLGHLIDGERGPPLLSLTALLGVVVLTLSAARHVAPRLVLATAALGLVFTMGREAFGPVVDAFPLNRSVQMFRYLGVLHLGVIFAIGAAVGVAVRALRGSRLEPLRVALAALVAAGLLAGAARGAGQLAGGFRTIDSASVDLGRYGELRDAMRRESRNHGVGRSYAFPYTGLHGHFYSGLLPLWDANDGGESRGVGLHDSLGFYFLEFFHPERAGDADLVALYGFQYLASDADTDLAHTGAEAVFANPDYTYWRMPYRVPHCGVVTPATAEVGSPRGLREAARRWLNGNGPAAGVHPIAYLDAGVRFGGETAAPVTVRERDDVVAPERAPGRVLLDQRAPDRAVCRVAMEERGAVLFRTGYHPYWEATLDGTPARLAYAFPAYLAVEVPPGEHEVTVRFRRPERWRPLHYSPIVGLAVALLLPAPLLGLRRRRGEAPAP
jgi:hypothetical protein